MFAALSDASGFSAGLRMDFLASLFDRVLNFFLPTGDPEIDRRRRFQKFSFFGGLIAIALFVLFVIAQGGQGG